jgi:2-C-methyl-D-erythritol 4-phosphate cytidylyltransferase/2-C-methyl-D-erythritol 2,4-cyclodiphosphate synthase
MNALAILVAAGRGERMGGDRPKAFLALAGEPLLLHSARAFEASPGVGDLVAVVPRDEIEHARAILAPLRKLRAVVAGGARRQDSVGEGMKQAADGFDGVVLVHDAARPFAEPALIDAVIEAAALHGAALPVLPMVDTVKRVRDGAVAETLDRSELYGAQTPQGFRFPLLARAYQQAGKDGVTVTDEAMAVERIGAKVAAVAGSARNEKITTPEDLARAEDRARRAAGGTAARYRTGTGFDAHRLVAGRKLMLGGVEVPSDRGLEGHSDGDCLIHAVCDALLGAAALGDMGQHFPSSDARWKGVPSRAFLEQVSALLGRRGFAVENLDATVIAQAPALGPHLPAMSDSLRQTLGLREGVVSVKAKSTDHLGALGRGEGIAAQAVVLLRESA